MERERAQRKRRFVIKELARERGLTSEALAIKAGVGIGTLRTVWQNQRDNPGVFTMAAIAKALGVRIEDLYVEEEPDAVASSGSSARHLVAA